MADAFHHDPRLGFILGDVRDPQRIHDALYRIDTVVNCAALKRVDRVTHDPREIFKTNIAGTQNVVQAAIERGIARVLVISSDKGCQPANPYGVSKAAAEAITIQANHFGMPRTRLACVRYGNVSSSTGSVVPVWRRQSAAGEPLTLTDERMVRFWMTVDQAVQFVLGGLAAMRGGEVLVPRLPSMRLTDLAEAVAPGHPIKITGLRVGGEKLSEALLSEDESPRAVAVPRLGPYDRPAFVIEPSYMTWDRELWRGEMLPEGFRYTSAENTDRLTVEQIRSTLPDDLVRP